jgi:transposase
VDATFADEDGIEALSPRIRLLIEDLRAEWRALDERIAVFDKEFVQMARNEEPVRRLVTIPGIGTINATALVAAVGNARAFRRGRDMAAWLGLTPRQMTGGKPRLLGIRASSAARPGGPPAFQSRDWRPGLAAGAAGAMGWRLGLHGLEQIAAEYSPRCTSPR